MVGSPEQLEEESRRYGQLQLLRMQMARQAQAQEEAALPEKDGMAKGVFIFFLIVCVIGDVIDFFTAGTIGWLIGIVIDFFLLITLGFSKKKKDQLYKILTGLGLETVLPIGSTLPFRTLFLLWAYWGSKKKTQDTISTGTQIAKFFGSEGAAIGRGPSGMKKTGESDTIKKVG